MNLKIRWSEPALLSLTEVLDYTVLHYGYRQASKMRRQVMEAVRQIARLPRIAPIESYSAQVGIELRGYLVIPTIKVIYSVTDGFVNIEYVKNTYLSERTMLLRMGLHIE